MIYLNETGIDQVFQIPAYHYLWQKNYAVFDRCSEIFLTRPEQVPGMAVYRSFLDILKLRGKFPVVLHRSFALGDVLMVLAVMNFMRRSGIDVYLDTDFDRFPEFLKYAKPNNIKSWVGLELDGVFELDHQPLSKYARMHRIDIMGEVLGESIDNDIWDLDVDQKKMPEFDVLIQAGGSTGIKTLEPRILQNMIVRLRDQGLRVAVFGVGESLNIRGVSDYIGRTSFAEYWGLIKSAKLLISQDSSPLWISHFTKTPVLLLHGPTRVKERLHRHPLYPEKTGSVDLAALVGCRPCFESVDLCNGFAYCMKTVLLMALWERIKEEVFRILVYEKGGADVESKSAGVEVGEDFSYERYRSCPSLL